MANDKYLGTDYFQMTGKHLMGNGLTHEIDAEALNKVRENELKEKAESVERLIEEQKDIKSCEDKILIPTTGRVIVKPYDKNPYRQKLFEEKSGLIIGDFETAGMYKSQETGEMEESKKGIWCCKVIAVGEGCKTVKEGEDVYINFMLAAPLPFGGFGYYSLSENNVICSIRNK